MADKLNEVAEIDVDIFIGTDLTFEVEWWLDDEETEPQLLSGAEGMVRQSYDDDTPVLDLSAFVDIDENSAVFSVPGSQTSALAPLRGGHWDVVLIADNGERKPVCRGAANIKEMATQ